MAKYREEFMINLHKIGENTTHNKDFFVDRPNGHPVYLLLLIKTPSLFLSGDEWQRIPADCAVIFRPGQTHCYRADNTDYTDCWLHFSSPMIYLKNIFLMEPQFHCMTVKTFTSYSTWSIVNITEIHVIGTRHCTIWLPRLSQGFPMHIISKNILPFTTTFFSSAKKSTAPRQRTGLFRPWQKS